LKISSKIAIFYLFSTILLSLFISLTLYISYARDLEIMVDEHLSEDTEQIKFLMDHSMQNQPSLKHILFEEYWLKITKNNQTVYTSEIAKSIPIPVDKIADNSTVIVDTKYINFTGNYDVIFRVHVKKYADGTSIVLAIAIDDSISENYKKLITILLTTLVIISVLVYFLMRYLLAPLTDISLTLRKLSEDKFNIGFTKKSDDEIGFLIESINLTFEKLRSHFTYQKNFLTIMSHELKTPLSVIKNHIEHAIEREDTPLEIKQKFANDLEQISKLNQLIHRLLLLTRLEEKTIIPKIELFNMSDLAVELSLFFSDLSESQNKRFTSSIVGEIFVNGDRELLYRAIFNILDNAIKYTPEDKEILFSLEPIDETTVLLSIKDEGGGIEHEIVKTVENSMFVKSTYDKDGIKNGVGLRLIIAILKLHNLDYKIESSKIGSVFKIFLKIL